MKRSALFFAVAGALAVTALVLGKRIPFTQPQPLPPQPPIVEVPQPPEQPKPPVQVVPVGSSNGSLTMVAHLSDPVLAVGGSRDEYLKIDITGVDVAGTRAPVNIAVVLDRSGSMAGEKLENARRAAHELVDRLNDKDRLAFITFGSNVTPLFPSSFCTSDAKAQMHQAIDKIYDMGGTNISGGLEAGLREVHAHSDQFPVNRVVLISDGEANEGITSRSGLVAISRGALRTGISVTAYGVGVDFDEDLMEQLAENGGGNYSFLRTGGELEDILNKELKQLGTQVASNPHLTLRLAPGVQVAEVYGYAYDTDASNNPTIQLSDFSAGEHRKVVVRLTVPANSVGTERVTDVRLDYTDLLRNRSPGLANATLDAQVSPDVQFAASQRDKDTYSQVVRVNAANRAKKAAILFSSGNVEEAEQELKQARSEAARGVVDYSLQGDAEMQKDLDQIAPAAPLPSSANSDEGHAAAKGMKAKAYDAYR
jgi:Ca-activated chloride channel family protein